MDDRTKWRLERISRKLTLTEIAKHIDRSISYVCAHENGRNTLTSDHYASYCNYILTHDNTKK
ncbi:hypothetical protein GCM10010913_42790 [Paenibacillus aceti]|uniref:HTH cro/C1-type domain-containing protein n=1 Tax=Paenibacillus aceti TaxID=1820010 RepID=A0ABQ1W6H4_9BACL|nr:hypothetical protein GCM10010913_42790 [Paenibacillus aceti]